MDAFKKEILRGKNNPMKIKNMSYRVEFQGRGAAHIHGTLWLDMKEIENSSSFKQDFSEEGSGLLTSAFTKFRDDEKLTEEEKKAIAKLTDMFATCSLNSDTVHEDREVGERIVALVKEVNCHNCTRPCRRCGDKCKYGFPKFSLKETLVVDKNEFLRNADEMEQELEKKKKIRTGENFSLMLRMC